MKLSKFNALLDMLRAVRNMGLVDAKDYIVIWEKKPKMVISQLGDFEFENPEEIYGVRIMFFDEKGDVRSQSSFRICGG